MCAIVLPMSVRMRHTSAHTKNRRSHHALRSASIVKDGENLRLPHRMDETTGMYRGKQIIPADELKRREERAKKREQKAENPLAEGININEPVHQAEDPKTNEKVAPQQKEGLLGRFSKGRAQARSGMGGGA